MPRFDVNLNVFSSTLSCVKYPLAVFFIVLVVRLVPEVLMGPYPLGFDTVACYLPNVIAWVGGRVDFWHAMATDPLLYMILTMVVALGLPVTLALKTMSSLLHGFLALATYFYSNKRLSWSPTKSLFTSLLACLYFVSLRISWDQLRLELGLVLTFLTLILIHGFYRAKEQRKGLYASLSLAMALVSLAHPLCAFLVLLIALATFLTLIRENEYAKARDLTATVISATLIFALNIFSGWLISSELPMISSVAPSGPLSYQELLSHTLGLITYCYLPLLPFVAIGALYLKSIHIRLWTVWSLVAILSPLLSPIAYIQGGYRWIYMLTFPFAFFTIEGFTKLRPRVPSPAKLSAFITIALFFALTVSWLAVGFITKPPESPISYFDPQKYNRYIFFVPSSMLQNTVSIRDAHDLQRVLDWLSLNVNHKSTLVLPSQFYGWAIANIDVTFRIVNFGEMTPFNPKGVKNLLSTSNEASKDEESKVYTIWWTPSNGWYGVNSLPSGFVEVERFGRLSVYLYAE